MTSQRISAEAYLQLNEHPTTIDLRTHAEIKSEHIEHSVPLPVQSLNTERFNQVLHETKHQGGRVYLLCQSGRRADIAISKLGDSVPCELVIIDGGLNALKAAGAHTKSGGRAVISLERQVRIAAGALTVFGVIMGFTVHPSFFGVSAFVGAGLMFAGITDTCGMALALARMPWNRV